jgi:polyisoprenoid-binding protein YceI
MSPQSAPQPLVERPLPARRQSRNPLVYVILVVLVAGLAAGGYGLWYLFLQPAGPAAVGQATLAPIPTSSSSSTAAAGSSAPASSAGASGSSGSAAGIDGTWNVDTAIGSFSDFTDSFVGYRVQEQLSSIGANTAVGRTPNVSGSMTISGTKVTAVTISADLTTLTSNDQRRDGQLDHQGIETSTYPTATFALSSPIDLGSVPADGATVSVTANGKLTLHGVTKDVQIPLKAQRSGATIEITGSLNIVFADYNIQRPQSFLVLSIDDHGTMELQLLFTKA